MGSDEDDVQIVFTHMGDVILIVVRKFDFVEDNQEYVFSQFNDIVAHCKRADSMCSIP